jgi:hypothetical protein
LADTEWKPLPAGLWTPPAAFMEAGNLLLEASMEAGVPTWKVREKTRDPLKWNMIAEGTADSFEAAKAAALYKAEQHCGSRKGPCDIWDEGMITVLGAMGHSADRQASVAVPDLLSDAQVAGSGASASPRNVTATSVDRTIADPPTSIGSGRLCPRLCENSSRRRGDVNFSLSSTILKL